MNPFDGKKQVIHRPPVVGERPESMAEKWIAYPGRIVATWVVLFTVNVLFRVLVAKDSIDDIWFDSFSAWTSAFGTVTLVYFTLLAFRKRGN